MTSFTGLWNRKNFNNTRDYFSNQTPQSDEPLDCVESGQFTRRDVRVGDFIYAVSTNENGDLLLIGKIQIGMIVPSPGEVEKILGLDYEIYRGEKEDQPIKYAIANFGTLMQFDTIIPHSVAKSLRFVTKKGLTSLTFQPGTKKLDGQTLRTMRVLTQDSANKLDGFLKSNLRKVVWHI